MTRWLLGRTVQAGGTFLVAVVLMFFVMRLSPGDPLAEVAGERQISAAEYQHLQERFGLSEPVGAQFRSFVAGVARGDLGMSIQFAPSSVTSLIAARLPATLLLGGTVLFINFTVGIVLGVWQAVHRGHALDRWLSFLTLAAYALPSFWLGLVLAWLFGIHWDLLPTGRMTSPALMADTAWGTRVLDIARHLILPAATLSIVTIAATIRYQRTAMIEALSQDYVRVAAAKGLSRRQVVWRHAWRNALFPVLTLFGLWLPLFVTGSVFVEDVFAWPGLGSLTAHAITGRDYPLIMGTAILVSASVVFGTWLSDVVHMILDPRLRHT
jgi:peptide/nickel transport system permease protein